MSESTCSHWERKRTWDFPLASFCRKWNHSAAKQVPNFCRKVAFFFLETKVWLLGTSPWEQPSGECMEVPGPFSTSKVEEITGEQSKARKEWVKWPLGGHLLLPDHYEQQFLLVACKFQLSRNSQICTSSFIVSPWIEKRTSLFKKEAMREFLEVVTIIYCDVSFLGRDDSGLIYTLLL